MMVHDPLNTQVQPYQRDGHPVSEAEFTRAWPGDPTVFAKRSPIELAVLHMVMPHVLPSEGRALKQNTFAVAYSTYDWRLNDLTDGGPR